jgi:hypothetical protein
MVMEGIEDSQDSFLEKETNKNNAQKLMIKKGPITKNDIIISSSTVKKDALSVNSAVGKNDLTSLSRLNSFPKASHELESTAVEKDASHINDDYDQNDYDYYNENNYKDTNTLQSQPQYLMTETFSQNSNLSLDRVISEKGGSQSQHFDKDEIYSEDDMVEEDSGSSSEEGGIMSLLVTELTSLKKSKRDKKIRKSLSDAVENANTQVDTFLTQWSDYRKSKASLIEGQLKFNLHRICRNFDEFIETSSGEVSRILTEDRELEDRRRIVQHDIKEFVKECTKEMNTIDHDINSLQSFLKKRKQSLISELDKEEKIHRAVKKAKGQR